jgi:hypothetical protein
MAFKVTFEYSNTLHAKGTCYYIHKIQGTKEEGSTLFIHFLDFYLSIYFWLAKKLTDYITANITTLIKPFLWLASL